MVVTIEWGEGVKITHDDKAWRGGGCGGGWGQDERMRIRWEDPGEDSMGQGMERVGGYLVGWD